MVILGVVLIKKMVVYIHAHIKEIHSRLASRRQRQRQRQDWIGLVLSLYSFESLAHEIIAQSS